jgi:hypothetical protein
MFDRLFDALYTRRLKKSARPVGGWQPRHVGCWTCGVRHALPSDVRQAVVSAEDFFTKHPGHQVNWLEQPGVAGLPQHNADVKLALQAVQTLVVTNLHSLASSVTAGWQSAVVDNSASLYLDALVSVNLDFANTAPANSKACFLYSYGGIESGAYTSPCTGTEGTLTLAAIDANPTVVKRIGTVPYLVQDAVVPGGPFAVAMAWGGALSPFWGVCLMNHSGAALAASGNTMKYRGTYLNVL